MMVIITGTPGTGKTSATGKLQEVVDAEFISINDLLNDYDLNLGVDEVRGYTMVDTDKMIPIIDDIRDNSEYNLVIFEGHLAQDYPNADLVIVLRCNPEVLRERLELRDYRKEKIDENVSAEVLGICTSESYEVYGDNVQEIDNTNEELDILVERIVKIIEGKEEYPVGEIDYLEEYFHLL